MLLMRKRGEKMEKNIPSPEKEELGKKLDSELGEEVAKALLQDLAMVFAKHGLVRRPDVCKSALRYMSFVIVGWNSVYSGQE